MVHRVLIYYSRQYNNNSIETIKIRKMSQGDRFFDSHKCVSQGTCPPDSHAGKSIRTVYKVRKIRTVSRLDQPHTWR